MADLLDTESEATDPDAAAPLSVAVLNDRIASVVRDTPALDGVVPGVAVLTGLDFLLGGIAVYLLSRASSSDVR